MNLVKTCDFATKHEDLIHHMAYDYYGRRLATCSSDLRIKIWEFLEHENKWINPENGGWKAHDGSVLRVTWAHPEFGQILASCSFDKSIKIWEEQDFDGKGTLKRWFERAKLQDSRGAVLDIEFAPQHLGLKLAACSSDGFLRIYEAMDPVGLNNWTMQEDIDIVSGSSRDSAALYCLSWCTSPFQPPMIAVGCGREARIYRQDQSKWGSHEILGGHEGVICDIAWAPNIGRSYHLIATASKDGKVRIFKLREERSGKHGDSFKLANQFTVDSVETLDHGGEQVWKVEWNVTGTVLSSSGDDGKVRLWTSTYAEKWICMGTVSAEL
ncbi:WD40-repeat-containing domain protein [Polychytrium aggregatum]|uniref:WD40-repeat-containing domain protein n=1 Tax=Polychytrium aggregatum TaxID=110093 RepID=UPI0022FEDBCC|nr:WD40-repeat-containing domain protein [Polychytrium aggregatum]KAI9202576.1 WD40-repeat-containing domain protein [Polychytrium aggregatum]